MTHRCSIFVRELIHVERSFIFARDFGRHCCRHHKCSLCLSPPWAIRSVSLGLSNAIFPRTCSVCYVPFSPLFPWLEHGLPSSQDPPLAFELRGLFHIVQRQRSQPPGLSATCPFRFGFVPITNSLRTKVSFLAHFVCASHFHARSAAKHDVGRLGRFQLPASADGLRFRRFFFVLARSVHAPAFLPRICTVAGAFARLANVAMVPLVRTFIVESFRDSVRCRMTHPGPILSCVSNDSVYNGIQLAGWKDLRREFRDVRGRADRVRWSGDRDLRKDCDRWSERYRSNRTNRR